MKKILTFALMAMIALSASAAKKKAPEKKDQNKPVFTTIKANPITSIKALVLRGRDSKSHG